MKKIAIIGANSFQNRLILKAKEMGYETHVFAWQCGDVGETTADFFYPISIVEKEQILEECKKIKPDGIASIASDLAVITVNYVAEALGLTCNDYKDSIICTNKYEMRRAFMEGGVPVPKFLKVSAAPTEEELAGFTYPLIVKPTDRSGSRGITKVNAYGELAAAVEASAEHSFEKCAVIEEFIEGDEYSCECVSYKGKHHFLALTKKYTTGAPHFIETGHRQPSDIPEEYRDGIITSIFKALDSLNIKNGASHTEFKLLTNGDIRIIEIGARMGGDCIGSDLVYLSTGVDFVAAVVDIACGNAPDLKPKHAPQKAAIRFLFEEKDLALIDEAKADSTKNIVLISDIDKENMGKVTDSSTRMGYYIYTQA
ncbi:MAG: ATP-grasp domain-containing protein [Ruminococcaceae bacterium]|nr:ATP-grasp domain-containing protein [Oscillospiraceae bacterium]